MKRPDIITVDIEKIVYEKISKQAEKNGTSVRKLVNETLLMILEKDEFLSRFAPSISKIGIQDNVMYLRDSRKDKVIEIRMKDGKLQCNDNDPIYLQYALALLEIVRLNENS